MMNRRIFRDDRRAVIVPIDHGLEGIVQGWEEPGKTLARIIEGEPDAVMTTYGNLKRYRHLLEGKVATLLRLDGGLSPYGKTPEKALSEWRLLYSVADAVRLGAAGVRITVWFGTPVEMDCVEMMTKVAADCQKYGLLLCVETYPVPGLKIKPEEILDPKHVGTMCRLAYEHGADLIKTRYTGSAESFRLVTHTCPAPILIAGGPKLASDWELLDTVQAMLEGGGAGVWYGRNVFQHTDPAAMVRALVQVIHYGATTAEALKEVRGAGSNALFPT
jgi:DhnA family fructose-bisphosphate aldolase class Ia